METYKVVVKNGDDSIPETVATGVENLARASSIAATYPDCTRFVIGEKSEIVEFKWLPVIPRCDACGERLGNEERAKVVPVHAPPEHKTVGIIHAGCFDPNTMEVA